MLCGSGSCRVSEELTGLRVNCMEGWKRTSVAQRRSGMFPDTSEQQAPSQADWQTSVAAKVSAAKAPAAKAISGCSSCTRMRSHAAWPAHDTRGIIAIIPSITASRNPTQSSRSLHQRAELNLDTSYQAGRKTPRWRFPTRLAECPLSRLH